MNRRKNINYNNKGITLIALTIMIIILIILAGISITGAVRGNEATQENKQFSELNIVQHAILERYTKSKITEETLPGTNIEVSTVQSIIDEINSTTGSNIKLKGTNYVELKEDDIAQLGIDKTKDTYIVNYETGEVINKTKKISKEGKALYIYSKKVEE